MKTERYCNIDLIKAIAMFFVVFYHGTIYSFDFLYQGTATNYILYFLRTILSVCVPIFFVTNGYLLFSKSFDLKKHITKTVKIIVITAIWGAITLALLQIIRNEYFTVTEFVKALWNLKNGWINHLWYMGALVCLYIFFPLLKQVFDTNRKIFMFFTVAVTVLTIGNTVINNVATIGYNTVFDGSLVATDYNFFNVFNPLRGIHGESFAYFCLGGVLYAYKDKIESISVKKRNIFSGIGMLVCCIGLWGIGIIYSRLYGYVWDVVYSAYDSIFTYFNVIFVFILAMNWKRNLKFVSSVSTNTMGIYFIHMIVITFLRPLVTQYDFVKNLPCNIIFSLVVLLISLGISAGMKKIPIIKNLVK